VSVNVCWGIDPVVAAGTPVNGNRTGALTPTGAGPWICESVAGAVRPDQDSLTVMVSVDVSRTTVPNPVAVEEVGGTSLAPLRTASKVIKAAPAWAGESARIAAAKEASAPRANGVVRRVAIILIPDPSTCKEMQILRVKR
jgi:hypothetical protein